MIDDESIRRRFQRHVQDSRDQFAASLDAERAATFSSIKVEGVLDASLGIVVTYDADRGAPAVLGRCRAAKGWLGPVVGDAGAAVDAAGGEPPGCARVADDLVAG